MRRLILAAGVTLVALSAQPAQAGFWSGLTSNFADWTQETAASIARGVRNTFGYAQEDDKKFGPGGSQSSQGVGHNGPGHNGFNGRNGGNVK